MEEKRIGYYRPMYGRDNIDIITSVLGTIKSRGAGNPRRMQCLLNAGDYGLFRIKDITFDNEKRCVYFHFSAEESVLGPTYTPGDGWQTTLVQGRKPEQQ